MLYQWIFFLAYLDSRCGESVMHGRIELCMNFDNVPPSIRFMIKREDRYLMDQLGYPS